MQRFTAVLTSDHINNAGRQIMDALSTIQNEQDYGSAEMVALTLWCAGSALAQIGVVIPTDGAIAEHLTPLAEGYKHCFAALSKKHAN